MTKFSRSGFFVIFLICIYFLGCKTFKDTVNITDTSPVSHREFKGKPVFESKSKARSSKKNWVDSVFNSLSEDEKIAQLFMVAAYSNKDANHVEEIRHLVEDVKIGGLIFMQGGPIREANLCNRYQSLAKTPLMISIDGEWGLSMRLDSTTKFPRQQMLGAIQNDLLIYEMGEEIARQCKLMGIHVNFAPVLDVNSNPENPVIGNRSFGEDKINVTLKGLAYLRGLQDNSVLACGKHFPGHGDTDVDSHFDLPVLKHSSARMDSLELFPFNELIENGLGSMMIGHLFVPIYDSAKNVPATLSKNIVEDILREKMKFNGLIFTDALNMQGVAKFYQPGEINIKALKAGNDVLLFADNVEKSILLIKDAISRNEISQLEIDKRVKRILKVKEWEGLNQYKKIETKNLIAELNSPKAELMNRKLVRNAITLLKNENGLIPLQNLDTLRIASVNIGDSVISPFQEMLGNYAPVQHFYISHKATKTDRDSLIMKLKDYNLIIAAFQNTTQKVSTNFGISVSDQKTADTIAALKPTILAVFANAYSLKRINNPDKFKSIVVGYEQSELAQQYAAMGIMGGIGFNGSLPVSSGKFKVGTCNYSQAIRLRYGIPEEVGMNSKTMTQIDSIVHEAIFNQATPGCQVWVAKDSVVVWNKSYGFYTYENKQKVTNQSIYDLASITKAASTFPVILKLAENGQLDYSMKLGDYLQRLKGTNKDTISLINIMTHRAGLKAYIPFGKNMIINGEWNRKYLSSSSEENRNIQVARGMYLIDTYSDSIKTIVDRTELTPGNQYVYSDLGMYYMKEVAEHITSKGIDKLASDWFYKSMGCESLSFNPSEKYTIDRIVPTEYDIAFRKQLLQGFVHDPMAAVQGGIGGHAGLFGNANDIGKLFYLYLNKGNYANKSYFSSSIFDNFNTCHFCNLGIRRGLILDKPNPDLSKEDPAAKSASLESFGHSGFTGTIAWVEPTLNMVYVFLSNRVYPDAENKKLGQLNIRPRIHQVLYDSIKK